MLLWFVTLALLGIRGILQAPEVLGAINPLSAVHYLSSVQPHVAFVIIGATFLAVTGGEAIYADLGHFGRRPIRLAWFTIVLPSLLLNYFGQGGLLLRDPDAIDNPFYQLAPGWAHYPLVLLAMRATTIASQAIISAAFSLTQQAMQLGLLPRMQVRYTAASAIGQIYMPAVNWLLAAATIALVLAFGSSDALAGAYGIAVSLLMAITTLLAGLVAIGWGYNPMAVVAVNGFFLVLDLFFFSANLLKFVQGGWFPLFLALTASFLMLTWRRGQLLVEQARARLRQPENEFLRDLVTQPPIPLPGMAVFLSSARTGVPLALTCFMRHTHALHGSVFLLSVETIKTPNVPESERVETSLLSDGVTRVILHFGFAQQPNVPEALNLAVAQGKLDETFRLSDCAYFVGRETIISASTAPKMSAWREALFAFMQRNSKREITCQGIPTFLVIQMGVEIQI